MITEYLLNTPATIGTTAVTTAAVVVELVRGGGRIWVGETRMEVGQLGIVKYWKEWADG